MPVGWLWPVIKEGHEWIEKAKGPVIERRTRLVKVRNERPEPVKIRLKYFTAGVENNWSWKKAGPFDFEPGEEAYLLDDHDERIHASRVRISFKGLKTNRKMAETEFVVVREPYHARSLEPWVFWCEPE